MDFAKGNNILLINSWINEISRGQSRLNLADSEDMVKKNIFKRLKTQSITYLGIWRKIRS